MNQDDFIKAFFLKNPEKVFEQSGLTHNSIEIREILDRFDLVIDPRPVYKWVKELLKHTMDFRYATDPDDMLSQSGILSFSEEVLNQAFYSMNNAIENTQRRFQQENVTEQDKTILLATLSYCKKSIKNRIAELISLDNRITPLWENSPLKHHLKD